jgi:hypothetical protein
MRIVVPPIESDESWLSANEMKIGTIAMIPRNIAPTRVIFERTL